MKPLTFRAAMVGVLVLAVLQGSALAHAFVDHASPAVGSTVEKSPAEVRIWLTNEIDPAMSGIEVTDAGGKGVDLKDSHRDEKDHAVLIVSLPPLSAGTYCVTWHVLSTDGHKTQGNFKFTVKG